MNKFKKEKHYKIPVVWEMHGIVEIKGESKEEAIENFKRQLNDLDLPEESYYVDESFQSSYDDEEELKAVMSPLWKLVKIENE